MGIRLLLDLLKSDSTALVCTHTSFAVFMLITPLSNPDQPDCHYIWEAGEIRSAVLPRTQVQLQGAEQQNSIIVPPVSYQIITNVFVIASYHIINYDFVIVSYHIITNVFVPVSYHIITNVFAPVS